MVKERYPDKIMESLLTDQQLEAIKRQDRD